MLPFGSSNFHLLSHTNTLHQGEVGKEERIYKSLGSVYVGRANLSTTATCVDKKYPIRYNSRMVYPISGEVDRGVLSLTQTVNYSTTENFPANKATRILRRRIIGN